MIVDGGATTVGIESTIIGVGENDIRLLREGPITVNDLTAATGLLIQAAIPGRIDAPGQLASHYAPTKPLRLNAMTAQPDEYLIGFGPVAGDISLSAAGDLIEAAARLFALLHSADEHLKPRIAVAPIPSIGLGAAINDRLRRAAAPR
jgi:L-threonylcarbamoyladenylate synthase